jgi:hypothetical protein
MSSLLPSPKKKGRRKLQRKSRKKRASPSVKTIQRMDPLDGPDPERGGLSGL